MACRPRWATPPSPTSPTAPRTSSTICAAAHTPRRTSCCSSCSGPATPSSRRSSCRCEDASATSTSPRSRPSWTGRPRAPAARRAARRRRASRLHPPSRRAPAPAAAAAAAEPARSGQPRVDIRGLDGLMDLIEDLVTARGRLNELAAERRGPAIDDVTIQISRLTADLQAEIIQARMTPVWQVFDRFPRLVRDLARQLGKQVAFRVEGKEIELDRAILDELGDLVMPLWVTAVDLGHEPA